MKLICLFAILLFAKNHIFAQQNKLENDEAVYLKYTEKKNENSTYQIIQLSKVCENKLPAHLIVRSISPTIKIIKNNDLLFLKNIESCIINKRAANNFWKYSPTLELLLVKKLKNTPTSFIISANNIEAIIDRWTNNKIPIKLIKLNIDHNVAIINSTYETLQNVIVNDADVYFVDVTQQPKNEIELVGYDRSLNGINQTNFAFANANGKNITIGIKENLLNINDIDLQKRTVSSTLASPQVDAHATVVASLAGGAGNSSYLGRGLAWQSKFYPSTFANLFPDATALLTQNNVTVQNHSYGTIIQNFYGAEAKAYDEQTKQQPQLIHVFSSGNSGEITTQTGAYSGIAQFANTTGNFKMAKNIITVGATDTAGIIASFSSAGPLYDGRLAPQISALGPNGTSDAAAIVSAAVALLQQVYKDSNSNNLPNASLVKAVLYNSADVFKSGITYKTGFGSLNAFNAVKTINKRSYFESSLGANETFNQTINIPANAANLKVTLSWTDTATSINNNKALVNDLDIEVSNAGNVYLPWVLSSFPSADSLKKPAVRRRDSLNTAEQISLPLPTSGAYNIKVVAKQINTINKQPFSVVYHWDTLNKLQFTNPLNAEDVNRNENEVLKIKWAVALADTNSVGNLFITYDNVLNWQQIATNIPLKNKQFNWIIPNTAALAQLRMNTAFGTFFSDKFIVAPITQLRVDYYCKDSLRLSWNKHLFANNYQMYNLKDSAYLSHINTITDTSVVLSSTQNITNIFAVQPILSNGFLATRSAAINAATQGVNCFYNTLFATDLNDKIQLSLELSTAGIIDSLVFEKLHENGTVLNVISKIKTGLNNTAYNAFDVNPTEGKNVYRVKMIRPNGSFYFTEIVTIISNGNQFIFLYPNPSKRNMLINYQVKSIPSPLTLQLYNSMGSRLQAIPIGFSGSFSNAGLPPGIYFYEVLQKDGLKLANGKIVVIP